MSGPNPLHMLLHLTFSPPPFSSWRGLLPTVTMSRASAHPSSRILNSIFTVTCLSVLTPFLYTVPTYRAHHCTPQRQPTPSMPPPHITLFRARAHPSFVSSTLFSLFPVLIRSFSFSLHDSYIPCPSLNANPLFILSRAHPSAFHFSTQFFHPVPTAALLRTISLFKVPCSPFLPGIMVTISQFRAQCPHLFSSTLSLFSLSEFCSCYRTVPLFSEKLENSYRKNTVL
jgi:hypothetical protein